MQGPWRGAGLSCSWLSLTYDIFALGVAHAILQGGLGSDGKIKLLDLEAVAGMTFGGLHEVQPV